MEHLIQIQWVLEVQEKMFKFLRMLDSYDSAIIPLGSDAVLRDRSTFYIYLQQELFTSPSKCFLFHSVLCHSNVLRVNPDYYCIMCILGENKVA